MKAVFLSDRDHEAIVAGGRFSEGSHATYKTKVKIDGIEHPGFFKALDPSGGYPEFLAKISVAASVLAELTVGKCAAEEYLVFNSKNEIIGTFSGILEGFFPFNYKNSPSPSSENREKAIPSTKTLLEHNFVKLAFVQWFLQNDDSHPGNNSLAGIIDFDMFLYWFTIHMKGTRPVVGVPYTDPQITSKDYAYFPNPQDARPFHCPTFNTPGQNSLGLLNTLIPDSLMQLALKKTYPNPEQFRQLMLEPQAQRQKIAAALKTLLTYQPEVLEKRLAERLGDLPLNYTSLGSDLSKTYETNFKTLCNSVTNREPFVKFMMAMHHMLYDALYRSVVFFLGYTNKEDKLYLPSTCEALYSSPSLFREVAEDIAKDNQTQYKGKPSLQLDTETQLTQRYHQVWRDAHLPSIKNILLASHSLIRNIINTCSNEKSDTECKTVDTSDSKIDNACAFISDIPTFDIEKIKGSINITKDSPLVKALEHLCKLHNGIWNAAKNYYQLDRTQLNSASNLNFTAELNRLVDSLNVPIRQYLFNVTTRATEFARIIQDIKVLQEHIKFDEHLTSTDEEIKQVSTVKTSDAVLPLNHPELVAQFNRSLFSWVKGLSSEQFASVIEKVIKSYENNFSFTRVRGPAVRDYLKASGHLPNDKRLAYIIATSTEECGALNTLLIENLTADLIKVGTYIPSIRAAVEDKTFSSTDNLKKYTSAAVNYAKVEYKDLLSTDELNQEVFFTAMYEWIEQLPKDDFKKLIDEVNSDYKRKRSMFSSAPLRTEEIQDYIKRNSSQTTIVALIFKNGKEGTKYNSVLFHTIMEKMQHDLPLRSTKFNSRGYELIKQYSRDQDQVYMPLLIPHATELLKPKLATEKKKVESAPEVEGKVAGLH